jgi:hypothetical protein
MFVCLFVCLFVWNYTNSHFWTDLNQTLLTSPPWSGRDRRVCMDPKFSNSSTFWVFFLWGPLQNHGHKMAAGATMFCVTLISVIPAGVRVTSPKLRCRRRRSHPLQPYIRDSSGSLVQPGDGAIRHSVISLILPPVSATYRKSRPCRRRLRVPTPSALHGW